MLQAGRGKKEGNEPEKKDNVGVSCAGAKASKGSANSFFSRSILIFFVGWHMVKILGKNGVDGKMLICSFGYSLRELKGYAFKSTCTRVQFTYRYEHRHSLDR